MPYFRSGVSRANETLYGLVVAKRTPNLTAGVGGDPDHMADGLLEAVRGLWLADPELGPKPLLVKLREQQPDLAAGNKEVRETLTVLKAESEATEAAAAASPAAAATPANLSRRFMHMRIIVSLNNKHFTTDR